MTSLFALDLEMNQPSGNIIQIGAAVGNEDRTVDTFSQVINLKLLYPKEDITEYIESLTGITNKRMNEEGVFLNEGYKNLVSFYMKYKDSLSYPNPLTWGGGDTLVLKKQVEAIGSNDMEWPFGRRWHDVKTLFVSYRMATGQKTQSGLARAMVKLGMNFDGKKHDATDDAANTIRIYFKLLEKFKKEI